MNEVLWLIIAGIIALGVGTPIVYLFDKWKREERDDD